jgi:hypothetical protein
MIMKFAQTVNRVVELTPNGADRLHDFDEYWTMKNSELRVKMYSNK